MPNGEYPTMHSYDKLKGMFEIGDVVYLESEPKRLMTVSMLLKVKNIPDWNKKYIKKQLRDQGYANSDDVIQCRWFKGRLDMVDYFKPHMLLLKSRADACLSFEDGDVVCLKSNPEKLMTVSFVKKAAFIFHYAGKPLQQKIQEDGYNENDDVIQCTWFFWGPEIIADYFKPRMLQLLSRDAACPVFEEGDIVSLKSDPQRLMVVSSVLRQYDKLFTQFIEAHVHCFGYRDGDAVCCWYDKYNTNAELGYTERCFKAAMLIKRPKHFRPLFYLQNPQMLFKKV